MQANLVIAGVAPPHPVRMGECRPGGGFRGTTRRVVQDMMLATPALESALAALRCPLCATPLTPADGALRCGRGHAFDLSRQGYVNLDVGGDRAGTADTPAMVAARERFLARGHYETIASAISSFAARYEPAGQPGIVLDLAGGTGYYMCAVLERLPARAGVCMDVSKPALRRAARAHPRAAAVGCDVWRALPVADQSAAIVMSAFGPRNSGETIRVLARDGVFILVTPTTAHLHEVIEDLGMLAVDPDKPRRLAAGMSGMNLAADETLTYHVAMTHADLGDLVAMGPSAHHVDPAQFAARVSGLPDPLPVTVSVRVAAYRPVILSG
jgi:23S rRNA (guanine745-N1)-methyltransferase